jgi:flagellar basal-body rod protein FlgC
MSLANIFKISSQGMTAQRERLESAAANLANASTTRTPAGGPYLRRDTIFEAGPIETPADSFDAAFGHSLFADPFDEGQAEGVQVSTQLADASEVIRRYQPNHPDAGPDGYVTLPAVDPLEETVNILSAARAFEANATAFNTAKEMARASLKLGENG